MIENESLRQILEAGIRAPSGENSQPWRFKVDSENVLLFNRPEADQSLYNFRQNGSLVSHGALLENIKIAAAKYGYEIMVDLFPDISQPDLVAKINFELKTGDVLEKADNLLFDAIAKRATNRKKYDGLPLREAEKKEILANLPFGVRLVFTEDHEKIAQLARAASTSETMLVLNKEVHDFFFSHVRWDAEENEIHPDGFYVDTLELNEQQAKGFKLMRKWGVARVLGKLGVAKNVGRDNEETYKTASAMVGVVIEDTSPNNLIFAGQALEHAWLIATKLGLSVQPSTGALFLAEGIPFEHRDSFSEGQRVALLAAKKAIYEALNVNEEKEHVAVLFRIGRSDPPSARAARFPLEAFLNESVIGSEEERAQKLPIHRQIVIERILKDLTTLKNNPQFANQYAIHELMVFFRAIRKYPTYVRWILKRAPKLDRTWLLELTDLSFPEWDRAMHEGLVNLESQKFPGLVTPLVNRLLELIETHSMGLSVAKPFLGLHLGCGGREVDRQVIKKMIGKKHQGQIVLVGMDVSSVAHDVARGNLKEIEPFVAIYEVEKLAQADLDAILQKENKRHVIIFAKNDIFDLPKDFQPRSFDVTYHTLFKHHLTDVQKEKLDIEITSLGKKTLEYDGLKSWPFLIGPHTWSSWQNPSLMNGSIFSNLRYAMKQEAMFLAERQNGTIYFSNIATYLLERER